MKKTIKRKPIIIDVDTGIDDCVAIGLALFSKFLKIEMMNVEVKYFNELGTGAIVCDKSKEPKNVEVCTEIDIKKFKKLYFKILRKMP